MYVIYAFNRLLHPQCFVTRCGSKSKFCSELNSNFRSSKFYELNPLLIVYKPRTLIWPCDDGFIQINFHVNKHYFPTKLIYFNWILWIIILYIKVGWVCGIRSSKNLHDSCLLSTFFSTIIILHVTKSVVPILSMFLFCWIIQRIHMRWYKSRSKVWVFFWGEYNVTIQHSITPVCKFHLRSLSEKHNYRNIKIIHVRTVAKSVVKFIK